MADFPSLLDVAQGLGANSDESVVAEILMESTEMLQDVPFVESNQDAGHQSRVRTGLPTPTWRQLYGGVQPTKGTTALVTDSMGMLEDYAEIDASAASLGGKTSQNLAVENKAHIQGMAHTMQDTLVGGNRGVYPERFDGVQIRYNDLSANNAENIIDAAGTGSDNGSIWMIAWDPDAVFGIYPKGSRAGLEIDYKGVVTIEDVDGNGGRMEAHRTHYVWKAGLVVKDWRHVVRICNIDRSELNAGITGNSADLCDLAFSAIERLPTGARNVRFYTDRAIREVWRQQATNKVANSTLTMKDVGGKIDWMFQDTFPIRRVDALGVNEARVT